MNRGDSRPARRPCLFRTWRGRPAIGAAVAAVCLAAAPAPTDLEPGAEAPPLGLRAIDGTSLGPADLAGRVVLVMFGESGQARTMEACREIHGLLDERLLAAGEVRWVLVLSKSSRVPDLEPVLAGFRHPPVVAHDATRAAFGAYGVVVMPTAVVVDPDGRVVYALAGYNHRFAETVVDAVDVGLGRMTVAQFREALHPTAADGAGAAAVRATRMARLAARLARRGRAEEALAGYREALATDPACLEARLGLGRLRLRSGDREQALAEFEQALALDPDSIDAALGVAVVCARGAPPDLDRAESLALAVLEREPTAARAHYVLGLVHEGRGATTEAVASFRTAAEMLLDGPSPAGAAPADDGTTAGTVRHE
jgi:hypothetical protein